MYAQSFTRVHSVSAHAARSINMNNLYRLWRHILDDSTSRRIFVFLTINFTFMFVEVVYGFWTNSLGLISDAGHMLFDCMALAIGLFASYVSTLKPNKKYTYGYAYLIHHHSSTKFFSRYYKLLYCVMFIMSVMSER